MHDADEPPPSPRPAPSESNARDHLANERTLLAWSRTGVAIMALGFVVARFGLLLRELGHGLPHRLPMGTATLFGIARVVCGTVLMALARYLRIARQIDSA